MIKKEESVKVNTMNPDEEQKIPTRALEKIEEQDFEGRADFGKSHESLDQFLARSHDKDDFMLKTGRTKLGSTYSPRFKSPHKKKKSKDFMYRSVEVNREMPANQQEGEAYDNELTELQKHLEDMDKNDKNSELEEKKVEKLVLPQIQHRDLEESHQPFYAADEPRSARSLSRKSEQQVDQAFETDSSEIEYKFAF